MTEKKHDREKRVDNIDALVAKNIKEFRLKKRSTIKEVSEYLKLSHNQYNKYETAKNRVSASVLFRLSKYFKVPISRFFKTD